jgi:hypothetical protein
MKISKRDAMLLLVLGGLLVFLALYMLVFTPFQNKTSAVEQKIAELEPKAQELEQEYLKLADYEAGIEEGRDAVTRELQALPADVREEDMLSYLLTLESRQGIRLESVTFDEPTLLLEFPAVVPSGETDASTTMDAYRTGAVVTAALTYPQLKSVVDYLYNSEKRTALDSVSVSYDAETGALNGSFSIAKYFVKWPEAVYEPEPLPSTPLGRSDLFGTT